METDKIPKKGVMDMACVGRIDSAQNERIKEWKRLGEKSFECMVIEGVRLVEEAWRAGVVEILLTREGQEALANGRDFVVLSERAYHALSDTKNPQGLMAICRTPRRVWEIEMAAESDFWLVADGLRDPGNVGTLIRIADAVGAGGVLLSPDTVNPWNPKVVRAAMGSVFHCIVAEDFEMGVGLEGLRGAGFGVLGGDLGGEMLYDLGDEVFLGKIAVVIGSEAFGMREEAGKGCTHLARIPMKGEAESLNAAVAAGVLAYEVLRRRLTNKV